MARKASQECAAGNGSLEPNPAGSAIVDALGPIPCVAQGAANGDRLYLVSVAGKQIGSGS